MWVSRHGSQLPGLASEARFVIAIIITLEYLFVIFIYSSPNLGGGGEDAKVHISPLSSPRSAPLGFPRATLQLGHFAKNRGSVPPQSRRLT